MVTRSRYIPSTTQSFNDYVQEVQKPTPQNGISERELQQLMTLARRGGPEGEAAIRRLQSFGYEKRGERQPSVGHVLGTAGRLGWQEPFDAYLNQFLTGGALDFAGGPLAGGYKVTRDVLDRLGILPEETPLLGPDIYKEAVTQKREDVQREIDRFHPLDPRSLAKRFEKRFIAPVTALQEPETVPGGYMGPSREPTVIPSFGGLKTPVGTLGYYDALRVASELAFPNPIGVAGQLKHIPKIGRVGGRTLAGTAGLGAVGGAAAAAGIGRAAVGAARAAPRLPELARGATKEVGREFADFAQRRLPLGVARFVDEPLLPGPGQKPVRAAKEIPEGFEEFVIPDDLSKSVANYGTDKVLDFESQLDKALFIATAGRGKLSPEGMLKKQKWIDLVQSAFPNQDIFEVAKILRAKVRTAAQASSKTTRNVLIPAVHQSVKKISSTDLPKTTPKDVASPIGISDSPSSFSSRPLKTKARKRNDEIINNAQREDEAYIDQVVERARMEVEATHKAKIDNAKTASVRSRFINIRNAEVLKAEREARENAISLLGRSPRRINLIKNRALDDAARRKQPRPSSAVGGNIQNTMKNVVGTSDEVAEHLDNTFNSGSYDPRVLDMGSAEDVIGLDVIDVGVARGDRWWLPWSRSVDSVDDLKANNDLRFVEAIEKRFKEIILRGDQRAKQFIAQFSYRVKQAFPLMDEQGRITSLYGKGTAILTDEKGKILSPTIQDVAARLNHYRNDLTRYQIKLIEDLLDTVDEFSDYLRDSGKVFGTRPDVREYGGRWLPRGITKRFNLRGQDHDLNTGAFNILTEDSPVRVAIEYDGGIIKKAGRVKVPGALQKSTFKSMSEGMEPAEQILEDGTKRLTTIEYPGIVTTISDFMRDVHNTVADEFLKRSYKAYRSEDGNVLWKTLKTLLFESNSPKHSQWRDYTNAVNRLKGLVTNKSNQLLRQAEAMVLDPDNADFEGLEKTIRVGAGSLEGASLSEIKLALKDLKKKLAVVKKSYNEFKKSYPGEQGYSQLSFQPLKGYFFPQQLARKMEESIGKVRGASEPSNRLKSRLLHGDLAQRLEAFQIILTPKIVYRSIQEVNQILRSLTATLDNSGIGIQLFNLFYSHPVIASKASINSFKTMLRGEEVTAAIIADFNTKVQKQGVGLTSDQWSNQLLEISVANPEVHSNLLNKGLGLDPLLERVGAGAIGPGGIFRRVDSMFANIRNSAALDLANDLYLENIAMGISPEEILRRGLAKEIAEHVNRATGFRHEGKWFNYSIANLILYSSRFFAARVTFALRALKGMDIDAIYDLIPPAPVWNPKTKKFQIVYPGKKLDKAVRDNFKTSLQVNKFATPQDRMARRVILRLIAYGATMTIALNEARNEETDFNVVTKTSKGKIILNSNFMKVRNVWGRDFSVLGPMHSFFNLVLGSGLDFKSGDVKDGFKRIVSSPVGSMLFDLATNKKFGQESIFDEQGTIPDRLAQVSAYIAQQNLPFSVQESADHVGPLYKDLVSGDFPGAAESAAVILSESFGFSSAAQSTTDMLFMLDNDTELTPQERLDLTLEIDKNTSGKEKFIINDEWLARYKQFNRDVFDKFGKPLRDLDMYEKGMLDIDPKLSKAYEDIDAQRYRLYEKYDTYINSSGRRISNSINDLDTPTRYRVKARQTEKIEAKLNEAAINEFIDKFASLGSLGWRTDPRGFTALFNDLKESIDRNREIASAKKAVYREEIFGTPTFATAESVRSGMDRKLNAYYSFTNDIGVDLLADSTPSSTALITTKEELEYHERYLQKISEGTNQEVLANALNKRETWLNNEVSEEDREKILKYVDRKKNPLALDILKARTPIGTDPLGNAIWPSSQQQWRDVETALKKHSSLLKKIQKERLVEEDPTIMGDLTPAEKKWQDNLRLQMQNLSPGNE